MAEQLDCVVVGAGVVGLVVARSLTLAGHGLVQGSLAESAQKQPQPDPADRQQGRDVQPVHRQVLVEGRCHLPES